MEKKSLLNRIHKKTWTRKIAMTDRSLAVTILVAAVASATATLLTKRAIKRMIVKLSTPEAG